MRSFREAVEAEDMNAVMDLLAENVELRSPIAFEAHRGRDAVAPVLRAVARVFEDFRYVREIGAPESAATALVFRARVGNKELEGCDFVHCDESGAITELAVMVRPLSAAVALAEAMQRQLATPNR